MIAKPTCAAIIVMGIASPALAAESWTCTYPAFGAQVKSVAVQFVIRGDKLISGRYGVPVYDLLENNEYAVIAADHFAKFDSMKGSVRIYSSTVIIDKTFGKFVYTIGEIGEEPGYRTGLCVKD